MALTVGSRLGHYDVTALIDEGGMGQVYQATDTKLKRQVAPRHSLPGGKSSSWSKLDYGRHHLVRDDTRTRFI